MSEQDNILFPDEEGREKARLSEEKLLAYLDGKLSAAEQHEVEEWLADDGMERDALEGLYGHAATDTKHSIDKINHRLRKNMLYKKRKRRPLKTDQFSWMAILIILLLVVIAYIVIRKIAQ
jgi:hypothetical protein